MEALFKNHISCFSSDRLRLWPVQQQDIKERRFHVKNIMAEDASCSSSGSISFRVKWRGKQIEMDTSEGGSVLDLKRAIQKFTDIPIERQKILNLFEKDTGNGTSSKKRKILATDKVTLASNIYIYACILRTSRAE